VHVHVPGMFQDQGWLGQFHPRLARPPDTVLSGKHHSRPMALDVGVSSWSWLCGHMADLGQARQVNFAAIKLDNV